MPPSLLVELPHNELNKALERSFLVLTICFNLNRRALGCRQQKHLHDALAVDPVIGANAADPYRRFEIVGQLYESHRGARVEPESIEDRGASSDQRASSALRALCVGLFEKAKNVFTALCLAHEAAE